MAGLEPQWKTEDGEGDSVTIRFPLGDLKQAVKQHVALSAELLKLTVRVEDLKKSDKKAAAPAGKALAKGRAAFEALTAQLDRLSELEQRIVAHKARFEKARKTGDQATMATLRTEIVAMRDKMEQRGKKSLQLSKQCRKALADVGSALGKAGA